MAQSGYTPIVLYNSTTAGHVPTTGNLQTGELAINVTDGKLYFNQAGTITAIATTSSAAGYASNLLGGAANRLVYQTGTNTTSFLAAPSVAGTALVWNGSALTYGSPSYAGNVTGTVAVVNGGTGSTSLTANNVLLGNGTSAPQTVAPGAAYNLLVSNGSTWTSSSFYASGIKFGLGITGEVWNSPSRALGTTYTNSNSYPIMVNVSVHKNGGNNSTASINFYVNGILVANPYDYVGNNIDSQGSVFATAIVPPGQTYQVNGGDYIASWAELY